MVEWKKLGDIALIVRGASPRPIKNFITDSPDGINWIKIGDVSPNAKYITHTAEKITIEGAAKSRHLNSGDFILSNSMSFGRPYILKTDGCIHDGWIAMSNFDSYVSSGYLYEILNSNMVQLYWRQKANNGGAMTNLNSDIVKETTIPIPSLAEQERIVGILDTFTAAIDNLNKQIELRKKQYEKYRDELLDLEGKEGVEMKALGEVCEIRGRIGFRGYTRDDQVKEGEGALSLSPGNIINGFISYSNGTYITWAKYDESPEIIINNNDIIFCKTGSTVGKVAIVKALPCKATINPQLVVLKNVSINYRFLAFYLATYPIQSKVKTLAGIGSVPNISQAKLANLSIPIPPLSEQHHIVGILDKFEAGIHNLEAQLSLRQKQYEYYRNQLLTFE